MCLPIKLRCGFIDTLEPFDIVFSSNVLEHLPDAAQTLEKIVQSAARYAVILLPFEDDSGIAEHVNIFHIRSFPQTVGAHHVLTFFRVIDTRDLPDTMWYGKQILLIYANAENTDAAPMRMAEFYEAGTAELIEALHEQKLCLRETQAALAQEQARLAGLEAQLNERAAQLSERTAQLNECTAQLSERTAQLSERSEQLAIEQNWSAYYREQYDTLRSASVPAAAAQAYVDGLHQARQSLEAAYALQKQEQTVMTNQLLYRIDTIRSSPIYRGAHLLTELIHLFVGSAEDRKAVWHWLTADRGCATKYHYLHEIASGVNEIYAQSQAETLDFSALTPERIRQSEPEIDRIRQKSAAEERNFAILRDAFARADADYIVVMPPVIDWDVPQFQRPHQLALAFAQRGVLCFFGTANVLDRIDAPTEVIPNCYLALEEHMQTIRTLARMYRKKIVLDIWSTDIFHYDAYFAEWDDNMSILYEYIDEISEDITGVVPAETLERHARFLADPSIYVVATAEKLYREVVERRGSTKNAIYSGNGVDLVHFQVEKDPARVPEDLAPLVQEGKPIVGYFGAMANWVDYSLLIYCAQQRPDYRFLLIGPHYRTHDLPELKALEQMHNVFMPGTIHYQKLPYLAQFFTVATVPFLLNDITESTSPIKLFEYMAMGKPVVTTDMPECRKYPQVRIGRSKEEFVSLLDQEIERATGPEGAAYAARMVEVAEENSWLGKAEEIDALLRDTVRA